MIQKYIGVVCESSIILLQNYWQKPSLTSSCDKTVHFRRMIQLERTLALIKPDSVSDTDEIIRIIKSSGFSILAQRRVKLSPEQVSDFYAEHYGKVLRFWRFPFHYFQMFFTNLVSFMSAGAVVALVLAKNDAIQEWRKLMGPTNPAEAKETFPDSIRALFGKGKDLL